MATIKDKIEAFFHNYEESFRNGLEGNVDIEVAAKAFAMCFVEASPVGVSCGQSDEKFWQAIPKGYEFYRQLGTGSMKTLNKEISEIDEFHHQCKVCWQALYQKKMDCSKQLTSVIYFLQHLTNNLKIFAYVTGNEQKVLQRKRTGLM